MTFRIVGLPAENFTHLFGLSDADLAAQGGVRRTVDGQYPCRVSLTDSQAGEELLLIEPVLEKMLAASNVDYLHVHFAAPGCYAAKVLRA